MNLETANEAERLLRKINSLQDEIKGLEKLPETLSVEFKQPRTSPAASYEVHRTWITGSAIIKCREVLISALSDQLEKAKQTLDAL